MGHSLGLGHSHAVDSIMRAEYTGPRGLGADDIAGIQALYGPPTGNQPPTPPPAGLTATSTTAVKVRSGPGTSYPVIGKVPDNTTVNAIGRNAAADWLFIDYNSLQGWAAGWLFTVNGDVNSLPVTDQSGGAPPPGPTQPPQPGTVTGTALNNVKMRLGPDTSYDEILTIPLGTTVDIIARTDNYSWILVEYSGIQGWCFTALFRINGSLKNLPVQ